MKIFKLGRKTIGTLDNGVFSKDVCLSRHLFRAMDAWGMDSKTLHSLPMGSKIVFNELEEGKVYKTTKEDFLRLGEQYLHFKNDSIDHRAQLFLRREHFQIENPPVLTQEEKERIAYMKFLAP